MPARISEITTKIRDIFLFLVQNRSSRAMNKGRGARLGSIRGIGRMGKRYKSFLCLKITRLTRMRITGMASLKNSPAVFAK
jgi:hypothetical protein